MEIRKLITLGLVATAGYFFYRCVAKGEGESGSQWADLPDPVVEENQVDEASWESFPASDPPSFNMSRSAAS